MSSRRSVVAGAGLGVAMAVSNAVGYLFILLVSRSLGPASFGELSALSSWGIVLSVPAGALQVIVARHVASGRNHAGLLRQCAGLGVLLTTLSLLAAAWLTARLGLQTVWSPIWLALTLVPMTLTGYVQGVLLGARRLRDLAIVYLLGGVCRVGVGCAAAAFGLDVATIFALLFGTATATACWGLTRSRLVRPVGAGPKGFSRELAVSCVSLGAFVALTNTDVALARALLDPSVSGGYALASTFGRAIGWATQFIALLMVPRVQSTGAARALALATVLTTLIGGAAVAMLAVNPDWWISLAGGAQYTAYASLVVPCAALGTLWAVTQVWLFADMGRGTGALGLITWLVLGVQVLVITGRAHERPEQILAVCAAGAISIIAVAVVREARRVRSGVNAPSPSSLQP